MKKSKFRKLFGLLSIRVSRLTRLMYHVGQTYIQAINYNHSPILFMKHSNYSFVRSRVQTKKYVKLFLNFFSRTPGKT